MKSRLVLGVVLVGLIFGCAHDTTDTISEDFTNFGRDGDGIVLTLSDLHFDPFYDPSIVPDLLGTAPHKWRKIFEGSKVTGFGEYGHDSNFPLLLSGLRHAGQLARRADFVVMSGDFLGHNFNDNYYRYAGDEDPKKLNEFIDKTMTFITALIVESFPDTPVYPALGNEDAYCGDYRVEPKGPFLHNTADIWKKLLRDGKNERALLSTFPVGGYYTVHPPREPKHRVIVLNTVFMSVKYQNACGKPEDIPAADELRWLADQLQEAESHGEKAWLVYHIPPGIDAYGTAKATGGRVVTMWHEAYVQPFLSLIDKYRETVVLALAGHTHMDHFRVDSHGDTSRTPPFLVVTPAISPIFANNPGMKVLAYHRKSLGLHDFSTHLLDLSEKTGQSWKEEYRFSGVYGVSPINGLNLEQVWRRLQESQNRANYIRYYNVDHTAAPPITDQTWPVYWCAIGNLTETAFRNCLTQAGR